MIEWLEQPDFLPQWSCQNCVDASFGQHTRALERASRKQTERQRAAQTGQTARSDRSDRFLGFHRNRSSRGITITFT